MTENIFKGYCPDYINFNKEGNMKKILFVLLMVAVIGLLGGTTANACDFLSCNFSCIPSSDGFKETTILEVVNQNEHAREGCVEVILWNASGHRPIGFKMRLNHYDLDKVNICKMLYEARRAGLISEIPVTGAMQVRLATSWITDLIQYGDLRNLGVNAWTTNYVASTQFAWRESEVAFNKIISSSKSNCVLATRLEYYPEPPPPFVYPSPDHWVQPVFIQGSGGPGDESCNEPE
jgi:hypothetical protein